MTKGRIWLSLLVVVIVVLVGGQALGRDSQEQYHRVAKVSAAELTPAQKDFIDRFESETAMEFRLHETAAIPEDAVCDLRLHWNKHKSYVERFENAGLPEGQDHPKRQIWADMWQTGVEFGRAAYRLKKSGGLASCVGVAETVVIEDLREVMQNHTLRIHTDTSETAHGVLVSSYLLALRAEIRDSAFVGSMEELDFKLNQAERLFGLKREEIFK